MTPDRRPVPFSQRWFDDYPVGETVEFGDYPITESEVVEFASRYDPQPFHLDAEAARESIYGGLIASGWMTASCAMRMLVDHYISPLASMGSPGIDQLRWLKPVRPGDRLRMRVTVKDSRRSQSKPDRGMVRFVQEVLNQDGVVVMTLEGWGMYRVRPGA
ncbi:MAG TPA: MaoC family dehydratase [Burkholderiaceae bacterium]|nr:MaoC family dehydratase [Burkholderiaceae bacterium]